MEMKIKTTMRYHPTLVRMSSKRQKITNVARTCRKGALVHFWWECKLVQPPWKTVWRFLKNLIIELPHDTIPLLDIYLKKTKTKTLIQKYICTLGFNAALFTIAKVWRQPKKTT